MSGEGSQLSTTNGAFMYLETTPLTLESEMINRLLEEAQGSSVNQGVDAECFLV